MYSRSSLRPQQQHQPAIPRGSSMTANMSAWGMGHANPVPKAAVAVPLSKSSTMPMIDQDPFELRQSYSGNLLFRRNRSLEQEENSRSRAQDLCERLELAEDRDLELRKAGTMEKEVKMAASLSGNMMNVKQATTLMAQQKQKEFARAQNDPLLTERERLERAMAALRLDAAQTANPVQDNLILDVNPVTTTTKQDHLIFEAAHATTSGVSDSLIFEVPSTTTTTNNPVIQRNNIFKATAATANSPVVQDNLIFEVGSFHTEVSMPDSLSFEENVAVAARSAPPPSTTQPARSDLPLHERTTTRLPEYPSKNNISDTNIPTALLSGESKTTTTKNSSLPSNATKTLKVPLGDHNSAPPRKMTQAEKRIELARQTRLRLATSAACATRVPELC